MQLFAAVLALFVVCAGAQDARPVLFTTDINVDGKALPLVVHEGDSPVALAQSFGAQHNLGADAVNSVAQHIVSKAGKFMKRVFFYFPFYVEVEGKSKMMNLTVYEDSDSAELGSKVAKKYGLPKSSADRLRMSLDKEIAARAQLRVNVDVEGGGKQVLIVRKDDTADSAAKRFAIQHGLTALGQKNLQVHIVKQLASLALRRKEKAEGKGTGELDPKAVFKGFGEKTEEKKEL